MFAPGDLVEVDFGPLTTDADVAVLKGKARLCADGRYHLIERGRVVGPTRVPTERPPFGDFPPPAAYAGRFTVNFGSDEQMDCVACRPEIMTTV
jgi:hypothetical protein